MSNRATRRAQKATALAAKGGGLGSSATGTRTTTSHSLIGGLIGAATGFVTGGPAGAVAGGIAGLAGSGGPSSSASSAGSAGLVGPSPCPPGTRRVGMTCVNLPFGGAPGAGVTVMPVGTGSAAVAMTPVSGSFGLPGFAPEVVQSVRRRCPRGTVLGLDDVCYPKAVLSRRSKFRKWRAAPRPPISHADVKAARRIGRTQDAVKSLAKDVGMKAARK